MGGKRKNFDANAQFCVNCGKDFSEKTNFEWSCYTHRGEYGEVDAMWWCCGKEGKDARGCKAQKHCANED